MVKVMRLFLALALLASFSAEPLTALSSPTAETPLIFTRLEPTWTSGVLHWGAGYAGTEVADVNDDGINETLTCNGSSAYALNYVTPGEYTDIWFSPLLGCNHLALMTLPGGEYQILITGTDRYLTIFNGADFSQAARFAVPDDVEVRDLLAGDVDKDGTPEIVLVAESATYILNGQTYAVEWKAEGRGGFQAGYGNIDTDPAIELVVNAVDTAYVLNPAARITERTLALGSMKDMDMGDIDGDGRAEIVFTNGEGYSDAQIFAYEPDLNTDKWVTEPMWGVSNVEVRDVDGGAAEVLVGTGQWGDVLGLRGTDGTELFTLPDPLHDTYGMTSGDTDNDGVKEVLFGGGAGTSGELGMLIADWQTETIEWQTPSLNGVLPIRAADVDADGEMEIVVASASISDGNGYSGAIRVFNGTTYDLERQIDGAREFFTYAFLDVGQLDGDPQLEILVAGMAFYDPKLRVFDGLTGVMEWESESLGYMDTLRHVLVAQLDGDPLEEIIYAKGSGVVTVLNGAGGTAQWVSPNLGDIQDITVGDANGNGVMDLAVLSLSILRVYNGSTNALLFSEPIVQARQVTLKAPDATSPGMYLVLSYIGSDKYALRAYSAVGFNRLWERKLPAMLWDPDDLLTADVEGDGVAEYIVAGAFGGEFTLDNSALLIGGFNYPNLTEYSPADNWGAINHVELADLDEDGDLELLFSAGSVFRVNEVSGLPMHLTHYSKTLFKACTPKYADTFADPASGWPIGSDAYSAVGYVAGEYAINLLAPFYWVAVTSGAVMGDGQVVVNVANISGWYSSHGLIFGIAPDWSSFYSFEIDPYQEYNLYYYDGGWTWLTGSTSTAILSGNATNRIKVERSGANISLYANDTLLTTWTGGNYTGDLRVGLIATSYDNGGPEVRYDNFAVFSLNCGTSGELVSTPFSYGLEGLREAVNSAAPESWLSGVNPRR